MTKLIRPVVRVTEHRASHAIRELVISLYPGGIIGLREKGSRGSNEVTVDAARLYLRLKADRAAERYLKRKKR